LQRQSHCHRSGKRASGYSGKGKGHLCTQAKESGKPEKVIEKIVEGKLKKFYSEACLLEQTFVKNSDITVQDLTE
jgi:translation elongation factor EF-Ts